MIIIVTFIFIFGAMTRMDNTATAEKTKDHAPYPVATDRKICSRVLLGPEGRVVIEHDGQRYLLRQTHAGKLILTK
jgi:hemin uptake protein HemP